VRGCPAHVSRASERDARRRVAREGKKPERASRREGKRLDSRFRMRAAARAERMRRFRAVAACTFRARRIKLSTRFILCRLNFERERERERESRENEEPFSSRLFLIAWRDVSFRVFAKSTFIGVHSSLASREKLRYLYRYLSLSVCRSKPLSFSRAAPRLPDPERAVAATVSREQAGEGKARYVFSIPSRIAVRRDLSERNGTPTRDEREREREGGRIVRRRTRH